MNNFLNLFIEKILQLILAPIIIFYALAFIWWLLANATYSILNFIKWLLWKSGKPVSDIDKMFFNIDFDLEEIDRKYNPINIKSNFIKRLSIRAKLIFKLVGNSLWGVALILLGFLLYENAVGNPYYEYQLISKGINTDGIVIDASEDYEPSDRGGGTYTTYCTYSFKTADGEEVTSKAKGSFTLPQIDSYIEVVYLKENPEINRLKDTMCDSMSEFFWRRIGIGSLIILGFASLGIGLIRLAYNNYKNELNKSNN